MSGATLSDRPAESREKRALLASALANGPAELIDFLLPLWAGMALGADAGEVGLLVGLEMVVSVVARPFAGVLADTRDRRRVAASGAVLYALACAGYAFAGSMAAAWAAAALGGVGGALLWVTVRAMIGERLADDSGVYPRLMAARENGAWIAFFAGLTLLSAADFRAVFLGCAAACLVAAGALLSSPRRGSAAAGSPAGGGADAAGTRGGGLARRLRPMLCAVALTMTAEAAIGLLLLLHLQRGFGLEVIEVAYVFLPGAVAAGLLPEYLHAFVVRFGRTAVLALASVASAVFALGLAWAPNPYAVAALWVLSGVAWAAVMPVQEAVIAEASGSERVGRGMGLYESAALVGGAIGTVAAGLLYERASWEVACVAAAAVILAGAAIVPLSVRALGVRNFPPPPPRKPDAAAGREPGPGEQGRPGGTGAADGTGRAPRAVLAATAPVAPAGGSEPAGTAGAAGVPRPAPAARRPDGLREAGAAIARHAAVFAVAQVALLFAGLSWAADVISGDTAEVLMSGRAPDELTGARELLWNAGRIWGFVFLIDTVWRLVAALGAELRRSSDDGAGG
ncbi:MFS transporter [Streptomyces marincola]|uniref:MFS transporter n=1 Tax=Streptomyces marincola TaxID=2878388 RepID=UPI001CF1F1E8|nr:MFS transporter [Streptomyces marincola]UCM88809.1 MFS transporter [Streptomyces marincola]